MSIIRNQNRGRVDDKSSYAQACSDILAVHISLFMNFDLRFSGLAPGVTLFILYRFL